MVRVRANFGTVVNGEGVVFEAQEVTFHTPSDHTIMGKRYPMELRIIHKAVGKNHITQKLIIAILFEKKAGMENNFIKDLNYTDLPNAQTKEKELSGILNLNGLWLEDVAVENMRGFDYYKYFGSLPYPPCDERTEL